MRDVRPLVPLAQEMVDACIPLAEGCLEEGDFTIKVTIKRRGGRALADVDLYTRASRAQRR